MQVGPLDQLASAKQISDVLQPMTKPGQVMLVPPAAAA